jgi:rubrerythrin
MTLEEAIKTAIDYEEKVRDVYLQARSEATNDVGKRVFRILSKEEQEHVDFLRRKQAELQDTGKVTAEKLATAIPSREAIAEGVAKLENKMESEDRGVELKMLRKAFQVEVETSEFYQKMVKELDLEGQRFFEPFLEIEEGHVALVQAEVDCLSGTGYWFDMREFSLEVE